MFIFMESVGSTYLAPHNKQGAKMYFLERLQPHALLSKHHTCISSNTREAIFHTYAGGYNNVTRLPHLQWLHEYGYRSIFLGDSFQSAPKECKQVLADAGFQHVLKEKPGQSVMKHGDTILLDAFDELLPLISEQPFFLQVFTTQTHAPYPVIQNDQFNRHQVEGDLSQYLNAIEESDGVLNQFLDQLGAHIDLSNTIVIAVGDHGQSFGQFGYRTHSNSTTNEQLHVPFLIYHPQFKPMEIPESTHFDIMPSLFDWLGIEYQYATLGQNLMLPDQRQAHHALFYSKTRYGNAPSQFSMWVDDHKYLFDLIYQRYYELSVDDKILRELKGDDKDYFQSFFYKVLQNRKLLST